MDTFSSALQLTFSHAHGLAYLALLQVLFLPRSMSSTEAISSFSLSLSLFNA